MIRSDLPCRLILVGLRGSGKTSAGKLLSSRIGAGFFDTDEWIEKERGKTIQEIFRTEGESALRSLERRSLETLQKRPTPEVVSTGGGIVQSTTNRNLITALGQVVYLQANCETLVKRIQSTPRQKSSRPKLTNLSPEDEMKAMNLKRHPLYLEVAHAIVDAEPSIEEVVEKLAVIWKSLCFLQHKRSADR